MKGGKRDGAGRPPEPLKAVMRIRLPLPVHEQVKALGGDKWVKRLINEALQKAEK
jgi:hypothetical protein